MEHDAKAATTMMQEKTNTNVTNTLDFLGPQGPLVVVVTGLWQISHGGSSLLQMIIRRGQPFSNDHLEGPAFCKRSSRGAILLQMIILRGKPLSNDYPEGPASCK